MKTVTYVCRHLIHTQRIPTIGFFTSARINTWTAHYLSSAQLDTIRNCADIKIKTLLYYVGEKQRYYSFETHVSNFKQAHLDLQKAGNEPDSRTKVRKFLQSIKAPDSP
jgi:hypothetical protein